MSPPLANADPYANFLAHDKEICAAIDRVLRSGHYILGKECEAFEEEFLAYLGVEHVVTVANGTDALELALRAVGAGTGDKVATVANTVTATAAAIVALGAEPVYVDIDPITMLIDAGKLSQVLNADKTKSIKAVVPVHLYGQVADMPAIMAVARAHGAKVVEDCAQAHGAALHQRLAGTWGDAAAFSFYPTKNLGALGDGGAISTNDKDVAAKVLALRQYGWQERDGWQIPGRNSRLDEMQAAILRFKLHLLNSANPKREALPMHHLATLTAFLATLPEVARGAKHSSHQFVIRTPRRHALHNFLSEHSN